MAGWMIVVLGATGWIVGFICGFNSLLSMLRSEGYKVDRYADVELGKGRWRVRRVVETVYPVLDERRTDHGEIKR